MRKIRMFWLIQKIKKVEDSLRFPHSWFSLSFNGMRGTYVMPMASRSKLDTWSLSSFKLIFKKPLHAILSGNEIALQTGQIS